MSAGQVAVALLKAKDVAVGFTCGFQQTDLLADELEAGQSAAQLHAVLCRHRGGHIGGDDGGHSHRMLRHGAQCLAGAADVVQQNDAHLVAGDEPVAALAVGHGGAAAVTVRVGAQQKIRVYFVAQFQPLLHGFPDLRVRVGAGGEVAVRLFLLRHHGHMGDAQLCQQLFHAFQTGAVQRSVHQLQIGGACTIAHTLGVDGIHKVVQTFLAAVFDLALGKGCVKVRRLYGKAVYCFNGGKDLCCHLKGDLAAVCAVDLVAVVLGGVVAGGDAHACAAAVVPHRPAQCRGGLQTRVDVRLDAVSSQNSRRFFCEHIALDAAVVADGHLLGQVGGVQIVGKPLGCLADVVDVHPVGACADDTTETTGAEFQLPVKTVGDGILVACNAVQFVGKVGRHPGLGKPAVILLFDSFFHRITLSSNKDSFGADDHCTLSSVSGSSSGSSSLRPAFSS